MTLDQIMLELEQMGSAQTKKVLSRHGAREPFFGVKVGDLKKIQKKVKHNHALALELYATGNGVEPLLEKSKTVTASIVKVENMNRIGKKRKTAFC